MINWDRKYPERNRWALFVKWFNLTHVFDSETTKNSFVTYRSDHYGRECLAISMTPTDGPFVMLTAIHDEDFPRDEHITMEDIRRKARSVTINSKEQAEAVIKALKEAFP